MRTVVDTVYQEITTCSARIAWLVGSPVEILVKSLVYGGITTTITEFLNAILDAYDLGNIDMNDPQAAFNIWLAAVRDYAFAGCIVTAAARWKSILAMALAGIYRAESGDARTKEDLVADNTCPIK